METNCQVLECRQEDDITGRDYFGAKVSMMTTRKDQVRLQQSRQIQRRMKSDEMFHISAGAPVGNSPSASWSFRAAFLLDQRPKEAGPAAAFAESIAMKSARK